MTDLRSTIRKDAIALATYFGLIIALQIIEVVAKAGTAEKWIFILGSAAYVVFVAKNHWVANRADDLSTPKVKFIGTCLLFVLGGLFFGIVLGVNVKFLFGSSI